jgi:hypothetical protein
MLIGQIIKRDGKGLREERKKDIKETEKGARELFT